jgi:hypothetical protein
MQRGQREQQTRRQERLGERKQGKQWQVEGDENDKSDAVNKDEEGDAV